MLDSFDSGKLPKKTIHKLPIVHRYLNYDLCHVQNEWNHWYMSAVHHRNDSLCDLYLQ